MGDNLRYGSLDELLRTVDADAFVVTAPPSAAGLYLSDAAAGWAQTRAAVINPAVFGAKGDVKTVADAGITAGQAIVTSPTAAFKAADVGKIVQVAGAGAAVTPTGTTSNVTNPTYITAVSSTAGIVPGMLITGAGIPVGTTVVGIIVANSIIEISQAATQANVGTALTISGSISGTITAVANATTATISVNAATTVTLATCTFGSDDSAAITMAAAAFVAAGRATLEFAAGDFFCSGLGDLSAASGTVTGAGVGATGFSTTLILKPGVTADMVTIGKLTTVRELGLDGNYLVNQGVGGRLIVVKDAYARLKDLFLVGATGNGIDFTTANSVGAHVRDVDVRVCQGYGVNIAANAFDNDFHSLNVGRSGKSGVNILASDSAFTLLHSWGNGTLGTANDQSGVVLRNGVNACRFAIPYLENNYDRGIYIPNAGSQGHSLNGGFLWKNRNQGLYAFGAKRMSLSTMTVFDNGQSGAAGHGSAGIENDSGTNWSLTGNTSFDDQATKTQTFAYFESNTADKNAITGNNWSATDHKTGSTTLVGANNIPAAANIGTLNVVV